MLHSRNRFAPCCAALWCATVGAFLILPPATVHADQDWWVTSAADDGAGSLRDALTRAGPGDGVRFDPAAFPPDAPQFIELQADLPIIMVPGLRIDASDAGVVLSGRLLSAPGTNRSRGLTLRNTSNVTIRGLIFTDFSSAAIDLQIGASGNTVGGFANRGIGPGGEGNIFCGGNVGIRVGRQGADDNVIVGNRFGVGARSGEVACPGQSNVSIYVMTGANRTRIGGETNGLGNVIGHSVIAAISVTGPRVAGTAIVGNRIGLDEDDTRIPNGAGIEVTNGATDTVIGGRGSAGNVISANNVVGVVLSGVDTIGTHVLGNHIGTDATGRRPFGNGGAGIVTQAGGSRIGGTDPAEANVVGGNGADGIQLINDFDTWVLGNDVGIGSDGVAELGNGQNGINAFNSTRAVIGSTAEQGEGNRVSDNGGYGVSLNQGQNVMVTGNEIGAALPGRIDLGNRRGGVLAIADETNGVFGNTIVGNHLHAARLSSTVRFRDNHVFGNERDVALISGGEVPQGETRWDRQGDLATYVVHDGKPLIVPRGAAFRAQPGVTVQFDHGVGVVVHGAFSTNGTPSLPIVLAPASLTAHPLPGDWQGLRFLPGSTGFLANTHIEMAATGIDLNGATAALEGGAVTGSLVDGIHVQSGSISIRGAVQLAGNGQDGTGTALRNDTATAIDARAAWWGAADGPRTINRLTAGGDRVTGPVRVDGWLNKPPQAPSSAGEPWAIAPVLNPGAHRQLDVIEDSEAYRWFRLPVGRRGSSVKAAMTGLAADFDLFLFHGLTSAPSSPEGVGPSSPEGIGPSSPEGIGSGELDGEDARADCSSGYLAELVRLGMAANAGQLVASSCRFGDAEEELDRDVWDQTGWYYLLAAPHNGAQAPDRPFDLVLDVRPGPIASKVSGAMHVTSPPVEQDVRTLILWSQQRFESRYGRERTAALRRDLDRLAADPGVRGLIVAVEAIGEAGAAFAAWDTAPDDPVQANRLANVIRSHVLSIASAQLTDIVLIGNDDLLPFHRVPDETVLSNERTYAADVPQDSPLGAALREGYFLSDVPYAASDGLPYRGRTIPAQRFNIGRLVETPEEIAAAVDAFLRQPTIEATSALVTGYDFLDDMAGAVADRLERTALGTGGVERLINDRWTPSDLLSLWTQRSFDLVGLNAHFTHRQAIAASAPDVGGRGFIEPADLARDDGLDGSLVFSVGCHSGLSVPDHEAFGATTDFAQIALGNGAAWLGNTGYGYGDADAIAYSERLMTLFVEHLSNGSSTGAALRAARADYLAGIGYRGLTPYDEKVLGVATLYGMPMQAVRLPGSLLGGGSGAARQAATEQPATKSSPSHDALKAHSAASLAPIGPLEGCRHGTAARCRTARFDFTYDDPVRAGDPIAGSYYTLAGESGSLPGQPIFARSSLTVTVPGMLARGAFLEGGRYRTLAGFDPVISRVVTDTSALPMWRTEPAYTRPGWTRTHWALVNAVGWRQDLRQRLVVTPEQYRPVSDRTGVLRQMEAVTYTLYYSNHGDSVPPSVWSVRTRAGADSATLQVEAADFSGVMRIAVGFTDGSGAWLSRDLLQAHDAEGRAINRWIGTLPQTRGLEYFVQAVDAVGNVVVNDNKGRYFTIATPQLALPIGLYDSVVR